MILSSLALLLPDLSLRAYRPGSGDQDLISLIQCVTPGDGKRYRLEVHDYLENNAVDHLESDARSAFFAELDDKPVGILIYEKDEQGWFINLIAVDIAYQRKNIGRILFQSTLEHLSTSTWEPRVARWNCHKRNKPSNRISKSLDAELRRVPVSGYQQYFRPLPDPPRS